MLLILKFVQVTFLLELGGWQFLYSQFDRVRKSIAGGLDQIRNFVAQVLI